ncbi:hypothetical protein [Leptospira adleri]|uniref:Uncharacterized protein n=1 Tax=Leptospira adleri TaxID=2023186 RepID=A0A2M9YI75_9LEPT|nr:hypothetical protein [Leptospira adleri]PJZ51245.1 hypothetical protein CH380_21130 [Leptospira adleri]PJZ59732.1 hypothetical protein CH376_22140 [Leptospira adleri]
MLNNNGIFSELGKFVRYIAPILIMIIELFIYRFSFSQRWELGISDNIWIPSILTVISGTFISFVYQALRIGRLNYQNLLTKYKNKFNISDELIKSNSFAVMSGIWYSFIEINKSLSGASKRSQQLANNLHGSGTSLVGCIIGFLIFWPAMYKMGELTSNGCYCLPFFLFLLFIGLHIFHFRKIKEDHLIFVQVAFDISQNDEIISDEISRFE